LFKGELNVRSVCLKVVYFKVSTVHESEALEVNSDTRRFRCWYI